MTAQGGTPRKLFDVELPPRLAELARKIEARAKQPIAEEQGEPDVGSLVAHFDDTGRPVIIAAKAEGAGKKAKKHEPPAVEAIALELERLWLRDGHFEKNMAYQEMRHPANNRLCRRLYRILEAEILCSECESLGIGVRAWLRDRMLDQFLVPVTSGKYRTGEADPGRTREGALDALEAAVAEVDEKAGRAIGVTVAEHDAAIARPFGLIYKVVEQHRPFDGEDRIVGAYYLAVPFLFDARKPSTPIVKTK